MARPPIAANAEPAALIDADGTSFSLTIVGEPTLGGLRQRHPNIGAATAAAFTLAAVHGLDVTVTRTAIRQHVDHELGAATKAEGDDRA